MNTTNNTPIISVIIPTYNRHESLSRAIVSCLNQSYKNLEIIIVDDASTDKTQEIVQSFKDTRIKYVRQAQNQGRSAARNTGIKLAIGEYINSLDDDDELCPDKIEKQLEQFQKSPIEVGVIYCGCQFLYDNKVWSVFTPVLKGDLHKFFLKGNLMPYNTLLIKKEICFQAGLYDIKLKSLEDWDFWIRISKHCQFDYVSAPMSKYYIHGRQISTNLDDKISSRKRILIKHKNELKQYPIILSYHFGRLGIYYYLNGHKRKARRFIGISLKIFPFAWKSYLYFLLIFLNNFFPGIIEACVIEKVGKHKLYH